MKTIVKVSVRDYDRALAVCNVVRHELGKRAVKAIKPGIPRDSACCPIAMTVGLNKWPSFNNEQDTIVMQIADAVDTAGASGMVHVQRGKRAA